MSFFKNMNIRAKTKNVFFDDKFFTIVYFRLFFFYDVHMGKIHLVILLLGGTMAGGGVFLRKNNMPFYLKKKEKTIR